MAAITIPVLASTTLLARRFTLFNSVLSWNAVRARLLTCTIGKVIDMAFFAFCLTYYISVHAFITFRTGYRL